MLAVITGGSGSGKSAFAEETIVKLGEGRRIYIATMMSFDEESKKRIQRHRQMRKDKHFETIECYTDLHKVELPDRAIVLLECMSNLTANEMYSPEGSGKNCVEVILKGVDRLLSQADHVCIVTNEIFSDGLDYGEETTAYQRYLGEINQKLVQRADLAVEVVYGIPLYLKGEKL